MRERGIEREGGREKNRSRITVGAFGAVFRSHLHPAVECSEAKVAGVLVDPGHGRVRHHKVIHMDPHLHSVAAGRGGLYLCRLLHRWGPWLAATKVSQRREGDRGRREGNGGVALARSLTFGRARRAVDRTIKWGRP